MKTLNFSLKSTLSFLISMFFVFNSASAIANTEIHWWHAMGGANGERVDRIAAGFNDSQNDYFICMLGSFNYFLVVSVIYCDT